MKKSGTGPLRLSLSLLLVPHLCLLCLHQCVSLWTLETSVSLVLTSGVDSQPNLVVTVTHIQSRLLSWAWRELRLWRSVLQTHFVYLLWNILFWKISSPKDLWCCHKSNICFVNKLNIWIKFESYLKCTAMPLEMKHAPVVICQTEYSNFWECNISQLLSVRW